jgi:hypothetical protein
MKISIEFYFKILEQKLTIHTYRLDFEFNHANKCSLYGVPRVLLKYPISVYFYNSIT